MRWKGRRESANIEDRRGVTPRGAIAGGGIGAVVIAVVVMLLGGDPSAILKGTSAPQGASSAGPVSPQEEELRHFVAVVLADTEDVWNDLLQRSGRTYQEPRLVIYRDRVQTGGGMADAAMGPFYMPSDQKVYLDLSFFDELARRFGAAGDFAQAYVIAHEVGHHVQHLLGLTDRVDSQRGRVSEVEMNRLSVRLELQADFLAGVWAHHAERTKSILESGDVEEALRAATAIGDDTLQKKARGSVVPDSFTHGTSAQRVAWFRHGLKTGDLSEGDTFDDAQFRRVNPR